MPTKIKKKKCSCCHGAEYHYVSDYKKTLGQVFCHKDNCHGWQNCDLPKKLIDTSKPAKH